MTVQKFIKYCLNTPKNLNPMILEQLVRDLMENGEVFTKVNGKFYPNVSEAIKEAPAGSTIDVYDDIIEETNTQITKDLTINLNGCKISAKDNFPFRILNEATLTINADKNSLIDGNIVVGSGNGSNGHLIINGGNYIVTAAGECAIQTNGNCNNSSIIVKNAKIVSATEIALYLPAGGKYIFENCEIEGITGIYAKAGEIELINCKVRGNGTFANPIPNGNGADSTGDAVILDSKSGYNGKMNLTVKNSELISNNGYAVHEVITDLGLSAIIRLFLESGKFEGKRGAFNVSDEFATGVEENKIECVISGGTYNSKIDERYLAEGKECKSSGIKFIVI